MVDKEQQHQPGATGAPTADGGGARRDLVLAVAAGAVVTALVVATGLISALLDAAEGFGERGPDVLVAVLLVVPVVAAVLAHRSRQAAAEARDRLHRLSHEDALTGLPNRRGLAAGFDARLREARRLNGRIAVLFVDLDGFKAINDTHGHDVGDDLMVAVAGRLREAVSPDDLLVRYGGDEFVVVCTQATNAASAERIARRLLQAIEVPFLLDGAELSVSGSVGIALAEERCTRPDEVLRDADAAMYLAKQQGPGRYALFDRSLPDVLTPSTAERRLRQALQRGEFRLYYQPIVSLWTKRLVGVETLLRWDDPDRGMVSPAEFMPALEETGLIVPIGNWVLEEVCRQSRRWQDEFPDRPPLNCKVNISARQLAQADFVPHLRASLEASGADPDRLCLEITEGALMYDVSSAWSTLREAKALGVSLALDDFGTGYSSLAYLRQFGIDLLKIDRSFVDGLGHSREDTTIIEHVVGLAKALGIVTVAEGVESEEQVDLLRRMACDLAQGYYFSHPQPPEVIAHLLDAGGNAQEWRPTRGDDDAGAPDGTAGAPVVSIGRGPDPA